MASGVAIRDECIERYDELQSQTKGHRAIIFRIEMQKEIVVDDVITKVEGAGPETMEQEWDNFCSKFPDKDCRYAVFDFEYDLGDDGVRRKIIFMAWADDDAKVRPKMLYASSKDAFRKCLSGVGIEMQCTDRGGLSVSEAIKKVKGE